MKAILFIILTTIALFSCDSGVKSEYFQNRGLITGRDMRKCSCCGGWFISIENKEYRFYKLPDGSGIDLDNEFVDSLDMRIELNWQLQENACMPDLIEVLKVRRGWAEPD